MQPFEREYQEQLIQRMTQKKFMEMASSAIMPELFDSDLSPIVEAALEYWKKGETLDRKQITRIYGRPWNVSIPRGSTGFDLQSIRRAFQYRQGQLALVQANLFLEEGDTRAYLDALKRASQDVLALNGDSPNTSEAESYFGMRKEDVRKGDLLTGLTTLDSLTGGIGKGELAVVLAVTGGGKSTWLSHIACNAVTSGRHVCLCSLEMSRAAVISKLRPRLGSRKKPGWGFLHMFCSSPGTATLTEIRKAIEALDPAPQVIVMDSTDDIAIESRYGNRWEQEEQMWREIKALASERDCVVWTAAQANRPGYGKRKIEVGDVAGALGKVRAADQVISINQSFAERRESMGRIFLAKNRYGEASVEIPVDIQWAKCLFTEDSDE